MTLRTLIFLAAFGTAAFAQNAPVVGIFEGQTDVGVVSHPGSAVFDPAAKTYTITGSGANMWAAEDDFHFVWKKISGDVTVTADISFPAGTGNAHKKGVLMVRRSLDKDSDYVDAALHVVGLTSLQSRDVKGGSTREVQSYLSSPKSLRLVRRGDYFYMFVAGEDGVFHLSGGSMKLALNEPFYVGIGVCAHDKEAEEKVVFSNVGLTTTPGNGVQGLYSTVEVVPVQSTDRRSVYVTRGRVKAPHFTRDGKSLIFEDELHRKSVPVSGGAPEMLKVGNVSNIGIHHGFSSDGSRLFFTDDQQGKAEIYSSSPAGGSLTRIPTGGPSYWKATSPDGKTLLVYGTRNGMTGIYATGPDGKESAFAAGPGVNDNPVFSPDGKYIYFDSDRTGSRQIWRMPAEGGEQEQVTKDDFANWNPHVSPDGAQVAFLTADKGTAGKSPDYDLKIRSMTLTTLALKIIANLTGGNETLASDPWSPDSKSLAFVSYQAIP
jgi:TolB protein